MSEFVDRRIDRRVGKAETGRQIDHDFGFFEQRRRNLGTEFVRRAQEHGIQIGGEGIKGERRNCLRHQCARFWREGMERNYSVLTA